MLLNHGRPCICSVMIETRAFLFRKEEYELTQISSKALRRILESNRRNYALRHDSNRFARIHRSYKLATATLHCCRHDLLLDILMPHQDLITSTIMSAKYEDFRHLRNKEIIGTVPQQCAQHTTLSRAI